MYLEQWFHALYTSIDKPNLQVKTCIQSSNFIVFYTLCDGFIVFSMYIFAVYKAAVSLSQPQFVTFIETYFLLCTCTSSFILCEVKPFPKERIFTYIFTRIPFAFLYCDEEFYTLFPENSSESNKYHFLSEFSKGQIISKGLFCVLDPQLIWCA